VANQLQLTNICHIVSKTVIELEKFRDGKICRSACKTRGPAVAADSLTRALDTGPDHQQTAANHSNSHKSSQCCQCWILQPNWTVSHSTECDTAVLPLILLSGVTFRKIVVSFSSANSS